MSVLARPERSGESNPPLAMLRKNRRDSRAERTGYGRCSKAGSLPETDQKPAGVADTGIETGADGSGNEDSVCL